MHARSSIGKKTRKSRPYIPQKLLAGELSQLHETSPARFRFRRWSKNGFKDCLRQWHLDWSMSLRYVSWQKLRRWIALLCWTYLLRNRKKWGRNSAPNRQDKLFFWKTIEALINNMYHGYYSVKPKHLFVWYIWVSFGSFARQCVFQNCSNTWIKSGKSPTLLEAVLLSKRFLWETKLLGNLGQTDLILKISKFMLKKVLSTYIADRFVLHLFSLCPRVLSPDSAHKRTLVDWGARNPQELSGSLKFIVEVELLVLLLLLRLLNLIDQITRTWYQSKLLFFRSYCPQSQQSFLCHLQCSTWLPSLTAFWVLRIWCYWTPTTQWSDVTSPFRQWVATDFLRL